MKARKKYFIIDFDSTFIKTEALEELAEIVLHNNAQKEKILEQIKDITKKGMEGKISFQESLKERLSLLAINKGDIKKLVRVLSKKVSTSILRNRKFFKTYRDKIYIVSGGFIESVLPIVKKFGISPDHVFANEFLYDKKGKVAGFNEKNPLVQKNGKVKVIQSLQLNGELHVIGDGYTDYQTKELGVAHKFIAFTENVERDNVMKKADYIAPSFDEFLYINKLPTSLSYPKNRINVLLLDKISDRAKDLFQQEGLTIDPEEKLKDASVICIRSRTKIPASFIEKSERLIAIGRYGIGVDHIDLKACSQKGIAVFNAPYSSGRSVVELVLGNIIALFRQTFVMSQKLHQRIWAKTSKDSHEVKGKILGIIGYGNIGSQLSVLAESLGMRVLFYDIVEKTPVGNAIRCQNLEELLKKSDAISVHMSGNTLFLKEKEFSVMKDGVYIINASRGKVVDTEVLSKYLKIGKIKGAAIDVFPNEPGNKGDHFVSPLQNLANVILTPHIGGSTEEAQKNIAEFVSGKIIDYINTGNTYLSVNFPNIELPRLTKAHRLLHLHRNIPGMLAKINGVMAKNKINILGQYLKTNDQIGYVITDVNKKYDKGVLNELKAIENTIRFRVLY